VNEAPVAPSKVSGHTILAFDFGTRWIGVAVGDTETRIANPLGMFEAESGGPVPREVTVRADGTEFRAVVRIDTPGEAEYFRHGGIMQYVLRRMLEQ